MCPLTGEFLKQGQDIGESVFDQFLKFMKFLCSAERTLVKKTFCLIRFG